MVLHRSVVHSGAIVAANSVILNDVEVPSGALAAGSPAVIKLDRVDPEFIRDSAAALRRAQCAVPHLAASPRLMRAFVVVADPGDVEVASDVLWGLGVRAIEERSECLWTGRSSCGRRSATPRCDRAGGCGPAGSVDAPGGRDRRGSPRSHNDGVNSQRRCGWTTDSWSCRPGRTLPSRRGLPRRCAMDPGGAFGLGDHPTTLLSLRTLVRLSRRATWRRRRDRCRAAVPV